MSERKPGFFKRLFSFGQAAPAEPMPTAETPVLPAPEPEVQETSQAPLADPVNGVEPVPQPEPETAAPAKAVAEKVVRKPTGSVLIGGKRKADAASAESRPARTGWFGRMAKGLSRSSAALTEGVASVFTKRKLDEDTLQDLEDLLIKSDLGTATAMRIGETLSARRYGREVAEAEVREVMAGEIEKVLAPVAQALELDLGHQPHVILVVGVNGSGKTTTIGKLAAKLRQAGLSTLLVAGDTFRAAAIEQLKIWGERTQSPVLARETGADAAGLAFDAWNEARSAGHDVMLMDTAGRLQNRTELMAELEKIIRVLRTQDPTAPHTVLLTLDATTGQNALNQVEIFSKVAGVTGLVMTKLDGTARGGILVAISEKFKLPVYFIGVGEAVEDLQPFEAADFARSIAGLAGMEGVQ
jgi:fused signal recognition particle receptor